MKDEINIEEKDLLKLYPLKMKDRIEKAAKELKCAGLLPFKPSGSESFRFFMHVFGLRYSDGCVYKQKRNNSYTFYICFGSKVDAERLVRDCKVIWNFDLKSQYGTRAYYVYLPASIARLMILAGSPVGRKTSQPFRIPRWVFELPDSLKWEFISGIFTGDGSVPRMQPNRECSWSIKLSLNSENRIVKEFCGGFMEDLWILLKQLDIKSSKPKIMWKTPRISKAGIITYPVTIRILTEKGNMVKFLKNVKYPYSFRYSKDLESVLSLLEGGKQISQLREYLANPSREPPRLCVFLGQPQQKELIENASRSLSENRGNHKKLAEYLYTKCKNVKNFDFLYNKYISDWKYQKKFIPIDYAVELSKLCNIGISDMEKQIKEVKFIRVHNKFAVPYG